MLWLLNYFWTGWPYSTCLQYHYVAEKKTWAEAQTYCRQTYADLVTIGNIEQNDQLLDIITSSGQSSEVWMGLYHPIEWRWSDAFSGVGTNYRNWSLYHPNFLSYQEFCFVHVGGWMDVDCSTNYNFVCYNGSQLDPKVVLVNAKATWAMAQKHCREHYVDLLTVTNDLVNEKVKDLPAGDIWIGLYRRPDFFWSDGNNFIFSNWKGTVGIALKSQKVICAVNSSSLKGKWKFLSCEEKLPFVCYGKLQVRKLKTLKLKITPGNSAMDLHDPAVKEAILKKLEERLKLEVAGEVNLKWRNPQDGKVFKKLHTVVDSHEDCVKVL